MVLRPSNCRWASHLSESYLHRWQHAVSEVVEIGSFGLIFESQFWKWVSQNRSPIGDAQSGQYKRLQLLPVQIAQAKIFVYSAEH